MDFLIYLRTLLAVWGFYTDHDFKFRPEDFSSNTSNLPPHISLHTWPTCTLDELSHLVIDSLPDVVPSPPIGTRLAFRLVFADTRIAHGPARFVMRDLGSVVIGDGGPGMNLAEIDADAEANDITNGRDTRSNKKLLGEPVKTLRDAKFVVGDYISCAVLAPLSDGSVAASLPPIAIAAAPRAGYGGPGRGDFGGRGRDNGFGSGFRGRGGMRGGGGGFGASLPNGEWRRGEAVPEGPSGGWSRGRDDREFGGRGRGRGRW